MKNGSVSGALELVRYGLVAVLAFSIDFGALIVFTEMFGFHYLASAAGAFMLGVTVAYVLSVTWAFKHRSCGSRRQELLLFVGIGVAGLGLNEFVMWNGTEVLGLHYLVSKMGSTVLVFFFNFGLRKMLLFNEPVEVVAVEK